MQIYVKEVSFNLLYNCCLMWILQLLIIALMFTDTLEPVVSFIANNLQQYLDDGSLRFAFIHTF